MVIVHLTKRTFNLSWHYSENYFLKLFEEKWILSRFTGRRENKFTHTLICQEVWLDIKHKRQSLFPPTPGHIKLFLLATTKHFEPVTTSRDSLKTGNSQCLMRFQIRLRRRLNHPFSLWVLLHHAMNACWGQCFPLVMGSTYIPSKICEWQGEVLVQNVLLIYISYLFENL